MKKNSNIIDDIIEYLKVESQMGTDWIPVRKRAGSGHESEEKKTKASSSKKPDAASSGNGRLAAIKKSLTTFDESEIKKRVRDLDEIDERVKGCMKCPLHESRTNTVFHEGSPAARLCFVGEGPGGEEDASGIPFVGRAGKLLTKIINAMGLKREHTYICNTVKCRPPGNRTPTREEMETCWPYLERQLEIVKPDLIVALGLPAAQMLVKGVSSISRSRGKWMEYRRIPVMLTYHPAYLLRNPSAKKLVWEDMKMVHEMLLKEKIEKTIVESKSATSLSLFEKKT